MNWYTARNTRILASLADGMTIADAAKRYSLSESWIRAIANNKQANTSKRRAVNKLTQMRYR